MKTISYSIAKSLKVAMAILATAINLSSSANAQSIVQPDAPDMSADAGYSQLGAGLFVQNSSTSEAMESQTYISIGSGLFLQNPSVVIPYASQPRMIGSDRRMAVVYECWYALNSNYKQHPDGIGPHGEPTVWGNTVSNWHYLSDDTNALQQVKSIVGSDKYGPNWTVATNFGPGDDYAIKQTLEPNSRKLGRGGQCTYFTCLILYRALGGFRFSTRATPKGYEAFAWGDLAAGVKKLYPVATDAQPGDVVFKLGSPNHVGICVNNFHNGTLEIVDSNFSGYGNKTYAVGRYNPPNSNLFFYNSEIIGRHIVNINSEGYRLFSGDHNKNPLGWY